jgi:hypothetical protein
MPPQAQQQLPENTGIGQLPAQNMQGMADGGIVGYADTGLVQSQLPGGLGIVSQGPFGPQAGSAELEKRIANIQSNTRMSPNDKASLIAQIKQEFFKTPAPAAPVISTNAAPTTPVITPTTTATPPVTTSTEPSPTPPVVKPAKPAVAPPAPTGGIDTLKQEKDAIDRFKNQMVGNTETAVDKTTFLKDLGDISKPAYDKANEMITKQKDQLKTDKEQDFYMSLIEGGLAAAGESGPNALQNIAKGFSKGASSYGAALKDLRKAAQENSKMEVDLARAEAADKKGDVKAYYERMDQYENRKAKRDDTINSGIAQIINTSEHGKYQLESTRQQVAGQIAAAGMPGAQERLFATLGGGDVAKGAELLTSITAGKRTVQQSYEDYLKAVAGKDTTLSPPLTPAQYVQHLNQLQAALNASKLPPPSNKPTGKVLE